MIIQKFSVITKSGLYQMLPLILAFENKGWKLCSQTTGAMVNIADFSFKYRSLWMFVFAFVLSHCIASSVMIN